MTKSLKILGIIGITLALSACTLTIPDAINFGPTNLLLGIWHGMLAPYILIFRFFVDNPIYINPASSWLYDVGFLLGILFSIPIGWIAFLITILLPFVTLS